uniref:Uncharacterized protein n=1 Tax=Mycena chlorophos TaxID=658473 RepID=A0ABQ0M5I5_MYCCL|nr:predicted protein [Mycena chlorophos]
MAWVPAKHNPKELRLEIPRPPGNLAPLFAAAHQTPQDIDQLLVPHLLDPALPAALAYMMQGTITQRVTPPLYWGGEPIVPQNSYLTCMVHATMIGRAFSLLSKPTPPPEDKTVDDIAEAAAQLPTELKLLVYAFYIPIQEQRRALWRHGLTPVLIIALMSGPDPEPPSRLAAAILVLACWTAIASARPKIVGRGSDYVWYFSSYTDEQWGLEQLKHSILETKKLPRENWDAGALAAKYKSQTTTHKEGEVIPSSEYVPLECITMLDAAREHVHWATEDLTSTEVVDMTLAALEQSAQAASKAPAKKRNWDMLLGGSYE